MNRRAFVATAAAVVIGGGEALQSESAYAAFRRRVVKAYGAGVAEQFDDVIEIWSRSLARAPAATREAILDVVIPGDFARLLYLERRISGRAL